jgi:uncharacterized protein (TIGR02246 family)
MRQLVLAVSVVMCTAPLASAQMDQGVGKVRSAYQKAAEAGDVQGLMALYTDDAVLMPPESPMVKGKAAIEAFHKKMTGMASVSNVRITPTDTKVMGDMAYDVGTFSQTVTPKGGTAMMESGSYVVVLAKQPDGNWKLKYEIYNSDKPSPMSAHGQKPGGH